MNKIKHQKPVRITVDLQPSYYSLLKDLQELSEAESHAAVIREALKKYFKELAGSDQIRLEKYSHIL